MYSSFTPYVTPNYDGIITPSYDSSEKYDGFGFKNVSKLTKEVERLSNRSSNFKRARTTRLYHDALNAKKQLQSLLPKLNAMTKDNVLKKEAPDIFNKARTLKSEVVQMINNAPV